MIKALDIIYQIRDYIYILKERVIKIAKQLESLD